MKNLFFLLTFILFGSLSYGQNINYSLINIEETNKPDFSINSERTISNDTVMDYIARASGMYITGLQDSGVFVGYASGNNPIFSEFGMRITRDLSSTESMNLHLFLDEENEATERLKKLRFTIVLLLMETEK